ncbi:MAG: protein translocase subunit SecD, partial [Niameybacter sp.]
ILFVLMLAVAAGVSCIAYFFLGESNLFGMKNIKLGLDLQGGVNIVYEAAIENPTSEDMAAALQMIHTRLTKEGYTEADASIEGDNRIRVDIPGVEDAQAAIDSIGAAAMLKFFDGEGNEILSGKNVKEAAPIMSTNNLGVQEPGVSIKMDEEGTKIFSEFTKANINKPIFITLDDQVISQANISSHIANGDGMISGSFTTDEAKQLAERIEAGSLPFALNAVSSAGVGAKLGMGALNTSITAGVIGFIFILIFMVAFYRFNGMASDLALVIYVGLLIIALSLTGSTLTLPGIAGIILSIGMAVDANVIIFTRIKEELAVGKSVRSAMDAGFSKAFSAILDGNITTLIAAAVLYTMGTGVIKSFATTLAIGIVVSMFTALVVTRFLLKLLVGMGIDNPVLYGAKNTTEKGRA